ncbi:MAG TPA: SDR family oxidoreductase [Candidatus Lokiarchaeia archaeon]|nr:SDR family oxidoreductase [Candidatus Lokiarchaeia archaeon]
MVSTENFMNWPDPGTALITGASSGIGAEFARQLAAQGFTPILVARRQDRLETLAAELQEAYGITAKYLVADLSKTDDIERVAARAGEVDYLDVLVSNAGFGIMGPFDAVDLGPQLDMVNVHNVAPVRLTHAILPGMRARKRGALVFVSSVMAALFLPNNTMYSATKAFLKAFAENLALDLQGTKIRAQVLCPGFTETEFQQVGLGYERVDFSRLPKQLWMSAHDVVAESLAGLHGKKVVVVPGEGNRKAFDNAIRGMLLNPE